MWTIVLYDLPFETKKQKKAANRFRKELVKDGFVMFQLSVYTRYSATIENAQTHRRRVIAILPKQGNVTIIQVTDKQFSQIDLFIEAKQREAPDPPDSLMMF